MPKTHPLVLAGALALAATSFSHAAEPSVEERLHRIEGTLARLEARLNDTVSADELAPTLKEYGDLTKQLGWDGKTPLVVAKGAGKENKLSVGGFIQVNGEAGGAPDARFNGINDRILLRRARLTVKGSFAENVEFTLQSDFGNNSLGGTSGYRAQLTDAFVTWTKYPLAVVQAGQFKTPFGYEQLLTDTKLVTVERSLPNDQLTYGRQIGLGVSGTTANKLLSYAAGIFNGNGVNNGNNDNDAFLTAGRIALQPLTGKTRRASVGLDAVHTRDTGTFTGTRTGWGADAQVGFGSFDLNAEYLFQKLDRQTGVDNDAEGWSVQATYLFPNKTWQAVTRYETYDSNTDAPATTSRNWVFGLSYLLKGDDLKLSLNYMLGDPAGPLNHEDRFLGRIQLVY